MTLEERIGVIGAVQEIASLSRPALAAMAAAMSEERFRPGEAIVTAGDPADRVFVLAAGAAEVTRGGRSVRQLARGALIGEIAFLVEGLRTATVSAVGECRVLSLPFTNYRELLLAHPRSALAVAARLAHELVEAEALLSRLHTGEDGAPPAAAADP